MSSKVVSELTRRFEKPSTPPPIVTRPKPNLTLPQSTLSSNAKNNSTTIPQKSFGTNKKPSAASAINKQIDYSVNSNLSQFNQAEKPPLPSRTDFPDPPVFQNNDRPPSPPARKFLPKKLPDVCNLPAPSPPAKLSSRSNSEINRDCAPELPPPLPNRRNEPEIHQASTTLVQLSDDSIAEFLPFKTKDLPEINQPMKSNAIQKNVSTASECFESSLNERPPLPPMKRNIIQNKILDTSDGFEPDPMECPPLPPFRNTVTHNQTSIVPENFEFEPTSDALYAGMEQPEDVEFTYNLPSDLPEEQEDEDSYLLTDIPIPPETQYSNNNCDQIETESHLSSRRSSISSNKLVELSVKPPPLPNFPSKAKDNVSGYELLNPSLPPALPPLSKKVLAESIKSRPLPQTPPSSASGSLSIEGEEVPALPPLPPLPIKPPVKPGNAEDVYEDPETGASKKEPVDPTRSQPWFFDLGRKEAEAILRSSFGKDCGFVVRPGTQSPFVLTILVNNQLKNVKLRQKMYGQWAAGEEKEGEKLFPSVIDLIEHHKKEGVRLAGIKNMVFISKFPSQK